MPASIQIVLALVVMVTLHELGHFLVARWVGIRASKFYVFFPPAIYKRQVGDVEYGLGSIPLGGFVSFPGMFQPVPREVHWRLEPGAEEVFSSTADPELRLRLEAAFNDVGLAPDPDSLATRLRALGAELEVALANGDAPVGPMEGAPRSTYERKAGKLLGRVRSGVEDCHPRAHWRAALWRRMAVILAGPVVNIVGGLLLLMVAFSLTTHPDKILEITAADIPKASPAYDAGVRDGDTIVRWNGERIRGMSQGEFVDTINATRGENFSLTVRRQEAERIVALVPRDLKGDGTKQKRVGVMAEVTDATRKRVPVGDAIQGSFRALGGIVTSTGTVLTRIFEPEVRKDVSSVVGVVKFADEAERQVGMLTYMAFISLTLGVFNLLPLLPLDGGHLLFGLVEFLRRGRALPRAAFERYSLVGLALVLGLFFIGLRNDLGLSG